MTRSPFVADRQPRARARRRRRHTGATGTAGALGPTGATGTTGAPGPSFFAGHGFLNASGGDVYYHTVFGHTRPFNPFGPDTTTPEGTASVAPIACTASGLRVLLDVPAPPGGVRMALQRGTTFNVSFGWICR